MSIKIHKAIGLMSGTSLDGVDIAYCTFRKKNNAWTYNLVSCTTIPYDTEIKNRLKNVHQMNLEGFLLFDREYGRFLGKLVYDYCKKNAFQADFLASHGHTVFHQPNLNLSYQLGHGASIAAEAKMQTICDFRAMDVALNGHGAPLVPIGDYYLFDQYDYCLNIGGIANITAKDKVLTAYDICPANYVLNYLAKGFNVDYDNNGEIASRGKINESLLEELNNVEFYNITTPKSLGREWIEEQIFPILKKYKILQTDKIRSFVEHIAIQISRQIKASSTKKSLLISGGGAYNSFLISRIKENLQNKNISVEIPSNDIIDYKEALIFAFLGVLRIEKQVNSLQSVTAASQDNVGGAIYYY
jgi:anhydro-N-acetylmuramic acid kinase